VHKEGEYTQCWDQTHKGPPYREGGPFFLIRKSFKIFEPGNLSMKCRNYKYDGSFSMQVAESEINSLYNSYAPTARTYGAEAFNKFRPVKPKVDAGQWIAELRDLPTIPWRGLTEVVPILKGIIQGFKNLGSHYLNYEFGWKPFVKDLLKMYETSTRIDKHLRFVENNNGRWLTRGGVIKNEQSAVSSMVGVKSYPQIPSAFYSSLSWPCMKTVITQDTVWFKARMKYFIYDLNVGSYRTIWNSKLVRHLYGLTLTPSLAWELIPFTWLQDWFCNFGDVIANMSNSLYDNLVTQYAYVMRHRKTTIIYDEVVPLRYTEPVCIGNNWGPYVPNPLILRSISIAECKERDGTNQYCFGGGGLLDEPATPRQQRILLALGVTRSGVRI
jgi:hypothetical protein